MTLTTSTDKYGREHTTDGAITYRLSALNGSSDKYGPCEVCGKRCPDTHIQTRLNGRSYDGPQVFGCYSCLVGIRRWSPAASAGQAVP